MENKPQNVFEKLDKQGEQIEDISQRLEGISINDLYALAKRTWDYGDFQTAQKYYNHISLLKPLDWEAPLYASLCNFEGYHDMFFWTKAPEQEERIIVSTIKYINNLELDNDKKESEMSRCVEIIEDDMIKTKDHYFKHKKDYDDTDYYYIYVLEEYFLNVYNEIKDIGLKAIKDFNTILAANCLSLIESTKKISLKITKEVFEELTSLVSKVYDIDYDKVVEENIDPINYLSFEEMKEIKLNGQMFFEYNDKVISKRNFKNKIIISCLLILFSLTGIISSFLSTAWFSLAFVMPFLYGLYLIIAAFTQKERINCESIFSANRKYNRLTSDGNIVTESKINIIKIVFRIGSQLQFILGVMLGVVSFLSSILDSYDAIRIITAISMVLVGIIYFFACWIFINDYYSSSNGKYSYYYNGKYYNFDR